MQPAPLLDVQELVVEFDTPAGRVRAVDGVSFSLGRGRTLCLVGESGCGKSVTALSLMRLIPSPPGHISGGRVLLDGTNLRSLPEAQMRRLRGARLAMVFQEPMTSLNPVFTVGEQLVEALRVHQPLTRTQARQQAATWLARVGIPDATERLRAYPHQLSGGMRQRVMLAMALCCRPDVLIADEPTTALDVTIQAQLLALLGELQKELGMAVLLITHDLALVSETADDVVVMYAGRVVEAAPTRTLLASPRHPYTRGLLQSIPAHPDNLARGRGTPLATIPGTVPALHARPAGCAFRDRCSHATDRCATEPPLVELGPGHHVRCHHPPEPPARTAVST